jgi:hypothetical protein
MRRLILAWILVFAAWCGTSQVMAQSSGLKAEELDQLLAPIALYPDSLQRLRLKAQANDKLKTTKQKKVATTQQNGRDIVIEPAAPQTLYVPYYDPRFATACRGVELPLPA